jgi:hypothetical protein
VPLVRCVICDTASVYKLIVLSWDFVFHLAIHLTMTRLILYSQLYERFALCNNCGFFLTVFVHRLSISSPQLRGALDGYSLNCQMALQCNRTFKKLCTECAGPFEQR